MTHASKSGLPNGYARTLHGMKTIVQEIVTTARAAIRDA